MRFPIFRSWLARLIRAWWRDRHRRRIEAMERDRAAEARARVDAHRRGKARRDQRGGDSRRGDG